MSIIKEFFSDDFKKIKTPETLGMIMILLLIFKEILPDQYLLIISRIIQGVGVLEVVVQLLQLVAIMYLILSVIVSFALTICTIRYIIVDSLYDYLKKNKKNNWQYYLTNDKVDKVHRFFIGSKIATLKVNSWFLVIVGHFYLFDESGFMEYYETISNYLNLNDLMFIPATIYFIVIVFSGLYLIKNIVYKLYFTY